jgi:hypothetical protein
VFVYILTLIKDFESQPKLNLSNQDQLIKMPLLLFIVVTELLFLMCYQKLFSSKLHLFWPIFTAVIYDVRNKLECFPWQVFSAESNVCW